MATLRFFLPFCASLVLAPAAAAQTVCVQVKRTERAAVIEQVKGALAKHPAAYPEIVVTSSEKGEGIETLRALIATME